MGVSPRVALPSHRPGWVRQHRGALQFDGERSVGFSRTHLGNTGRHRKECATMTGLAIFFSAIKILAVFSVLMFIVAYAVWVERKLSAAIQDRRGPNRVGPFGLLQPAADAVKSFLKEDFTPSYVRKAYFWLAPAIAFIPALLTMAVIPFGSNIGNQKAVIADLNVGILYTFGIISLGVYG